MPKLVKRLYYYLDLLYNNQIILIGKDYFKNLNLIYNLTKE